jgi:dolichyl-phosphate-mannose-protein mannosyltransferase
MKTGAARGLDRLDVKLLLGLLVVAFLLRLLSPIFPDFVTNPTAWPPVRAWGMGHPFQSPNGYIFDEVYFAQDACKDLVGKDYYDPEPPLAKLFIAGGMVVGGTWLHYDRGYQHQVTVDPNGTTNDNLCVADGTLPGFGTWGWRLTPLVFGSLIVPLAYLLALRLTRSRFAAFAAALLVCFDGMFFVQSRIAMIDIVAEFFLLLTYWLFLVHRDSRTEPEWWRSLALLGLAVGLAVSAKWTTMAALGTIMVFLVGGWAVRMLRERRRSNWDATRPEDRTAPEPEKPAPRVGPRDWAARPIFYVLLLVAVPALIYGLSWFRYNSIPQCSVSTDGGGEVPSLCSAASPGPGPALRLASVEAGPLRVWVPAGLDLGLYIHQVYVHDRWAYDYHAHLTATHPYGSKWFSWPLLLRPVAYYYQDGLGTASICPPPPSSPLAAAPTNPNCTLRSEVFNLGNPAIWWFSIPCLLYCAVVALRERSWPAALIVVAFLAAWLPFVRVTRVMFLYHMFGGLPFMILAVAFTLHRLRGWTLPLNLGSIQLPRLNGTHLATAYLGLVLVVFAFLYPLWSALPITGDSWNQRIWFQVPSPIQVPFIGPDTRISWI